MFEDFPGNIGCLINLVIYGFVFISLIFDIFERPSSYMGLWEFLGFMASLIGLVLLAGWFSESKYRIFRFIGLCLYRLVGLIFILLFLYVIYLIVFEGLRLEDGFTPLRAMPPYHG